MHVELVRRRVLGGEILRGGEERDDKERVSARAEEVCFRRKFFKKKNRAAKLSQQNAPAQLIPTSTSQCLGL